MNNILRIDNDWTYPIIRAKLKYFPLVSLETSTLRDTQSENTVNLSMQDQRNCTRLTIYTAISST